MWVVRPYKLVSRLKKACVNGFCYLKQKKTKTKRATPATFVDSKS
jgi:hypothetical protein